MNRVDVAIIGAGLAGATCVRELAASGIDAVAFDRAEFPREKVCGGFLSPGAVRIIHELDMLDALRAAGAVEIHSARVRAGGSEVRFELPQSAFGISRHTLDALFASHPAVQRAAVRNITRNTLRLDSGEVRARVIVDASGRTSRFTARYPTNEFGVQFYGQAATENTIDFWFFDEGYGGAVRVEGGRSNCCFLISKAALPRYIRNPACRVTGPIAYRVEASPWIAIGDATGMVDPFCGEGMRHALYTGRLAARVIADGLRRGVGYDQLRQRYDAERAREWKRKAQIAWFMRKAINGPSWMRRVLTLNPVWFLKQLWR